MDLAQGAPKDLVSRRQALVLLGAVAAAHGADAAEQAIMQPVSLDHVNIRVSNVAKTAEFYMGLFDTLVLRNAALRAQPTSPPSEGFFLKFGDGYLAISQAFAPDTPDLDHYSVGLRDYEKTRLTARLQDNGIAVPPRSSTDVWLADLDGALMQLRQPGGWARQTAVDEPHRAAQRRCRARRRLLRPSVRHRDRVGRFRPLKGIWIGRLGPRIDLCSGEFGLCKARVGLHPSRREGFFSRNGGAHPARARNKDRRRRCAGGAAPL